MTASGVAMTTPAGPSSSQPMSTERRVSAGGSRDADVGQGLRIPRRLPQLALQRLAEEGAVERVGELLDRLRDQATHLDDLVGCLRAKKPAESAHQDDQDQEHQQHAARLGPLGPLHERLREHPQRDAPDHPADHEGQDVIQFPGNHRERHEREGDQDVARDPLGGTGDGGRGGHVQFPPRCR
jgi:hypothetical protein